MVKEDIKLVIDNAIKKLQFEEVPFVVERPADLNHGDYATNVAMMLSGSMGKPPRVIAEAVVDAIDKPDFVEKVEIAGAGFINFYLKAGFFVENLQRILKEGDEYGKSKDGQKVLIEYTDPNVMKPFHIGHLMSNTIGESLSRLYEFSGAEVKRANYFSDVGLGIAKAVWGMKDLASEIPSDSSSIQEKTKFLGKAYAHGVSRYEEEKVAEEVNEINKKIYTRTDPEVNSLYQKGREWSVEHFSDLYKRLGSNFDFLIAESEVADAGMKTVKEFLAKGVFKESDGAVVFVGENYDPSLHTRVFITKEGLPTYEGKEIGLLLRKNELYKADKSIVITANEQDDYFKVVLRALREIEPELEAKTVHMSHGIMKLSSGKMSSRTGNVITAEDLIEDVKEKALERMSEKDNQIAEQISLSAIRYSILKQSSSKDIIFDFDKSLSFEGDSGPYLQYTFARCNSLITKGEEEGIAPIAGGSDLGDVGKMLERFPESVLDAKDDNSPHVLAGYLSNLASSFNSYYAKNKIVDLENKEESANRLAVASAVKQVLKSGLWCLGIEVPERM